MLFKRPMLAGVYDPAQARWPMLATPKLDGIRAMIQNGKLISRSGLPIPNRYLRSIFEDRKYLEGLDGELIINTEQGNDPLIFRRTTSAVMSASGIPDVFLAAFDLMIDQPYSARAKQLSIVVAQQPTIIRGRIEVLQPVVIKDEEELARYEAICLRNGHEGVILRDPDSRYKHGRSTAKEGGMLKVKRFVDSEALVIGVAVMSKKERTGEYDAMGRMKRDVPINTTNAGRKAEVAGALRVRDIHTGVEFDIGTGLTERDRLRWIKRRNQGRIGRIPYIVKYKYFDHGGYDVPRHPVLLGERHTRDMDDEDQPKTKEDHASS